MGLRRVQRFALGALAVLALASARTRPSLATGGLHGRAVAGGARARLAGGSALCAKKKATKATRLEPDDYFKYLQSGQDRTEEDTSPPSEMDAVEEDEPAAVAAAAAAESAARVTTLSSGFLAASATVAAATTPKRKPRTQSTQTAELIASEASKGFLETSEELRWYLINCTPGFERSIGRGLAIKAEHAGYGQDIVEARVPLRRTLVYQKRAKGYVPKEEPLMAGYVMVRMRMRRNLYNFIKDTESVLGFCGYDFGARNLAGGLKAGRGFVKPKPLSRAEVARIDAQEGQAPIVPEAEYGVPEGAAQAARAALALEAAGGEGAEAEASDEAAVAAPAPVRPRPVRVEVELSYRVGERVRVLKGPFKNLEGPVLAIEATADDGEEAAAPDNSSSVRVTVELSLMGQPTVVDLDARALVSVLQ